nr:hypothetical protein [Tanacetum cinerariifolium]
KPPKNLKFSISRTETGTIGYGSGSVLLGFSLLLGYGLAI